MSLGETIRNSQVWKSVFRHPMPIDRRNRIVVMLTNFFLHLHPVSIKKQGIALSYTWCMGGVTFFLFLVETVTGVLLMFYYRPTLEWAYNDILSLRDVTSLGIMRELHRWGAHAMVITTWLHMYRVFLTGSYKKPRQFNWVVGVLLLLLTLGLSFTGYLLPWDQLAFWAITVGTNIGSYAPLIGGQVREILIGGHSVGEAALLRFYVLHVAVFPALVILLTIVHFWRVRKDGGLSRPIWKLKPNKPDELVTIGAPPLLA